MRHKLTEHVIRNELSNFKGTPKKLAEFEKKLRNKFSQKVFVEVY